jgi:hypothetical protein
MPPIFNIFIPAKKSKPNIIHSVLFNFIFKVRQMYNSITLIVHFPCPTCFEPLIWVYLQGHIIQNCTLFTPTGTIIYMNSLQFFTYTV